MTDEDEVPDGACEDVALEVEALATCKGLDRQDVLLLKALPDVIDKLRDMTGEDESVRVKFAANRGLIAIAERVARAMRRDLMADQG